MDYLDGEGRSSGAKLTRAKKKPGIQAWVQRTTRSQEQEETVVQYISASDQRVSEYFGLILNDGNYSSLDLEEWMVLLVKPA